MRRLNKIIQHCKRESSYLCKETNNYPELNEIYKQESSFNAVKILNFNDCQRLFPMANAIDIQADAFISTYLKETVVPERIMLTMPGMSINDITLFKPAVTADCLAQKIVSVRNDNNRLYGLPNLTGCIILLNKDNGLPICLMDCELITGRRTAAGSGLATDLFAKKDSKVLTVFGSGFQAYEHVRTVYTVRGNSISTINIINRTLNKCIELRQKLINECGIRKDININVVDLKTFRNDKKYDVMISDADIICTCTAGMEYNMDSDNDTSLDSRLFDGKLLKNGVHINSIGTYTKHLREIGVDTIERSYIFVDSSHAFDCGDLYQIKKFRDVDTRNESKNTKWMEIGQYLVNKGGKTAVNNKIYGEPIESKFENTITLFESVGVAAQDLHSANFIYNNSTKNNNIGKTVYL